MNSQRRLEALHRQFCAQLGVPPGQIRFGRRGEWWSGCFDRRTGDIRIRRNLSSAALSRAVAHETYHYWQWMTGRLTLHTYNGTDLAHWMCRLPYSKWPWERAAERFSKRNAS